MPSKEIAMGYLSQQRDLKLTYNGESSATFPKSVEDITNVTMGCLVNETLTSYDRRLARRFPWHIINYGLFDYGCKQGPGEFCANEYGIRKNFRDLFVLPEDLE
jgi:hypothetical protein